MFLLKTFESFSSTSFSKNLQYHIDNNISIVLNIFRPGSEAYFELLQEVRELFDRGEITLQESDSKIFNNTDIGRFVKAKGKLVPLDLPVELNEETEEPKYFVYVKNMETMKLKKMVFSNKKRKSRFKKDKSNPQYWINNIKKYINTKTINDYW